jgi:uncharacterized SAM-binding protein YcdF (DUF218 family)
MFFFLSKTLNYITMPIVIIGVLFILSFFLKSKLWRARMVKAGIILFLFFSNDFVANEVVLLWEIPPTPFAELPKKYAYGILLTGVTKFELEPGDRVYFSRGADRVTHTLQLYRLGYIQKILVSGGNGKLRNIRKHEADLVAEALLLMGVPEEDIIIENISRNTHESAVEVAKLIKGKIRPEDCLLVTSSFHIRRSRACFYKQDLRVALFSTDFVSHKRKFTPASLIIPSVDALTNWQILIKEWTGMIAYKLVGYI